MASTSTASATSTLVKATSFKKFTSHRFSSNDEINYTPYFLRAGNTALITAWHVQIGRMYMTCIGRLSFDLKQVRPNVVGYLVSNNTVSDACQIKARYEAFAVTTLRQRGGEVIIAISRPPSVKYNTIRYFHPFSQQFSCCTSNFFTNIIGLGCNKEVCLYTVEGLHEIKPMKDNITSIAYNKKGTVLYMGTKEGNFVMYDVRTQNTCSRFKLDEQELDDVLPIKDENYSIISGFNNILNKVDHRMMKVVVEYPGHYRKCRRIPVTVDEKMDLLCCTGGDDITRLWCLSTGELLKSIEAPTSSIPRGALVPSSVRGRMYIVQDHFVHVYSIPH